MIDSVINKAVRQCGLRLGATLLCKLTDCEYPFTGVGRMCWGTCHLESHPKRICELWIGDSSIRRNSIRRVRDEEARNQDGTRLRGFVIHVVVRMKIAEHGRRCEG